MASRSVLFAHGKESGPWGSKITALADVARQGGWEVVSPDYSVWADPDARVAHLLAQAPEAQTRVLVGSSMGGYVSTVAAATLRPAGLFLMAPAFYIPHYQHPAPPPQAGQTLIVHGWQDEVVPVDHTLKYAERYQVPTCLLPAGHRLTEALPMIIRLFAGFLEDVIHAKAQA